MITSKMKPIETLLPAACKQNKEMESQPLSAEPDYSSSKDSLGTLLQPSVKSLGDHVHLSSSTKRDHAEEKPIRELLKESKDLQNDINIIFAELSDLNRQVRIDIDDFCHIGVHSNTTIDNGRSSEMK